MIHHILFSPIFQLRDPRSYVTHSLQPRSDVLITKTRAPATLLTLSDHV